MGERESGDWKSALPLISTEIYFYRRLLDCTGYFRPGPNRFRDPYALQKRAALEEGLRSPALLHNIRRSTDALGDEPSPDERRRLLHDLLLASLWGNQVRDAPGPDTRRPASAPLAPTLHRRVRPPPPHAGSSPDSATISRRRRRHAARP